MVLKELIVCITLFSPIFSKSFSKEEEDTVLWSPKGVSREDWIKCHYMPCDQWERTKLKLMRLKILASSPDQDNVDRVLNLDVMNINDTALQEDDFNSCIWLAEEQLDGIIKQKQDNVSKRRKRKIAEHALFNKWTFPIRFKFDGSYTSSQREKVKSVLSHVEAQTCVEFKEIGLNDEFADNYLIFTKASTGYCNSFIGKVHAIPQAVNLAGCISSFGIMVHEIGHALGLWHEQQRVDRDDHIEILWDKLGGPNLQYYKHRDQKTFGVEYDVGSVMHYGQTYMKTLDPLYQHNMGQRTGFSFNDAKIINKAYCANKCNTTLPKPCQRGGYQDPKACGQCRCAPGFGGKYCDQVAASVGNCGGVINLDNTRGSEYITSPGYNITKYDNHLECNWFIKAPVNTQIKLTFEDRFRLLCSRGACYHWVEVKYRNGLDIQGPRFCCYDTPSVQLISDSNEMAVIFRSNYTTIGYYRFGFKAKIELAHTNSTSTTQKARTTTNKYATTTTDSTITSTTTTTLKPTTTTQATTHTGECVMMDVGFLLDSSGSIANSGWQKLLEYVRTTIQKFRYSEQCAKFSVISIGNRGYLNIGLDYTGSKSALLNEISQLTFRDEWTNTGSAFEVLLSEFYSARNEDRKAAEKIAVLLTDEYANRGPNVLTAAQNAREAGVNIIGIGIGNKVDKTELAAITNEESCLRYGDYSDILQEGFINNVVSKMRDLAGMKIVMDFKCTFEDESNNGDWCGIQQVQNDNFEWTLQSGASPSEETGPSSAYNGQYYIFIETSSPRKENDRAIVELPAVNNEQKYCLRFAYHMYGFHINSLAVYTKSSNGQETQQWSKLKQQGKEWKEAKIEFNMNSGDTVLFEAKRGEAFSGDIAIDDVSLKTC